MPYLCLIMPCWVKFPLISERKFTLERQSPVEKEEEWVEKFFLVRMKEKANARIEEERERAYMAESR